LGLGFVSFLGFGTFTDLGFFFRKLLIPSIIKSDETLLIESAKVRSANNAAPFLPPTTISAQISSSADDVK
jgi:hypothetical protein